MSHRYPPDHSDYRPIVQPFLSRPRTPDMAAEIELSVSPELDMD